MSEPPEQHRKKGPQNVFTCKKCHKILTFAHSSLSGTNHDCRPVSESPYACFVCHKTFTSSIALRIHGDIHMIRSPYTCMECKTVIQDYKKFVSHHRTKHANVTIFGCDLCKKVFRHEGWYNHHMNDHSAEKKVVRKRSKKQGSKKEPKQDSKLKGSPRKRQTVAADSVIETVQAEQKDSQLQQETVKESHKDLNADLIISLLKRTTPCFQRENVEDEKNKQGDSSPATKDSEQSPTSKEAPNQPTSSEKSSSASSQSTTESKDDSSSSLIKSLLKKTGPCFPEVSLEHLKHIMNRQTQSSMQTFINKGAVMQQTSSQPFFTIPKSGISQSLPHIGRGISYRQENFLNFPSATYQRQKPSVTYERQKPSATYERQKPSAAAHSMPPRHAMHKSNYLVVDPESYEGIKEVPAENVISFPQLEPNYARANLPSQPSSTYQSQEHLFQPQLPTEQLPTEQNNPLSFVETREDEPSLMVFPELYARETMEEVFSDVPLSYSQTQALYECGDYISHPTASYQSQAGTLESQSLTESNQSFSDVENLIQQLSSEFYVQREENYTEEASFVENPINIPQAFQQSESISIESNLQKCYYCPFSSDDIDEFITHSLIHFDDGSVP